MSELKHAKDLQEEYRIADEESENTDGYVHHANFVKELIERIDQVLDAAPKAVQGVNQKDVELSPPGQIHNLDELRPLLGRARIAVIDQLFNNFPATVFGKLP